VPAIQGAGSQGTAGPVAPCSGPVPGV